jgi:hypothetical protein
MVTRSALRFRAKHRTKPADAKDQKTAELKARIRELEAELARERMLREAAEAALRAGDEAAALQAENAAWQDEVIRLKIVLDSWNNVIKSRESGIMVHANFKLIRSCLHPDSRNSASDEKLARAFRVFNRLEYVLCDEAELPTKHYALTTKELAWLRGRKERQKLAAKNAKRRARSDSAPRVQVSPPTT